MFLKLNNNEDYGGDYELMFPAAGSDSCYLTADDATDMRKFLCFGACDFIPEFLF